MNPLKHFLKQTPSKDKHSLNLSTISKLLNHAKHREAATVMSKGGGPLYLPATSKNINTEVRYIVHNQPPPILRIPKKDVTGKDFTPATHTSADTLTAAQKFGTRNIKRLPLLGHGRDRNVYLLEPDKVLKIARNPKGVEQNLQETNLPYLEGLKFYEEGKDYVVVEKANPPGPAVKTMLKTLKKQDISPSDHSTDLWQKFTDAGVDTKYLDYDIATGDFLRKSSWGEKEGKPVLIDAGTLSREATDRRAWANPRLRKEQGLTWENLQKDIYPKDTEWGEIKRERSIYRTKGKPLTEQEEKRRYYKGYEADPNTLSQYPIKDDTSGDSQIYLQPKLKKGHEIVWDKALTTRNLGPAKNIQKSTLAYTLGPRYPDKIFIGEAMKNVDTSNPHNVYRIAETIGHEELHNILGKNIGEEASHKLDNISMGGFIHSGYGGDKNILGTSQINYPSEQQHKIRALHNLGGISPSIAQEITELDLQPVKDTTSGDSQIFLTPHTVDKHKNLRGTKMFTLPKAYPDKIFITSELKNVDPTRQSNINALSRMIGHEELHHIVYDIAGDKALALDKISIGSVSIGDKPGKEILLYPIGANIYPPSEYAQKLRTVKTTMHTKNLVPIYGKDIPIGKVPGTAKRDDTSGDMAYVGFETPEDKKFVTEMEKVFAKNPRLALKRDKGIIDIHRMSDTDIAMSRGSMATFSADIDEEGKIPPSGQKILIHPEITEGYARGRKVDPTTAIPTTLEHELTHAVDAAKLGQQFWDLHHKTEGRMPEVLKIPTPTGYSLYPPLPHYTDPIEIKAIQQSRRAEPGTDYGTIQVSRKVHKHYPTLMTDIKQEMEAGLKTAPPLKALPTLWKPIPKQDITSRRRYA